MEFTLANLTTRKSDCLNLFRNFHASHYSGVKMQNCELRQKIKK